jgi:hypothetical protein
MSATHTSDMYSSEESLAKIDKSIENGSLQDVEKPSTDRLPAMDLNNGLVGWESEEDPENPQ